VALQNFAKAHLKALTAKRIALTGSSGKTTTKELIRCALAACLSDEAVIASGGNLNNHIGVPLSALKVRPEHKAAIFEMGMNHFGEIATLTRIVSPDVGLIINIGSAHSGNLGGAEGVAKAKAELFENMSPHAIAVVNVDDPRCVREAESKVHGRRINFGRAHWADLRLKQVEAIDATHQRLVFAYKNRQVEAVLPMPGFHNALNACAALAVACALSLDLETAAKGLQNMKAVKGRLRVHELKNEVTLIDDTYNANPESMEAGLTVLASYPETRRRVAVLGGMGELGDKTPGHHRSIGALVAQKKIDALFTCGESAIAYAEGAIAQGFDRSQIVWAENSEALAAIVADKVKANDVIFVKGSRTTSMEKVVEKLLGALAEVG
jgi:UDP-N-acetylmuramoyl-tripeptide--D-alanyl-D-alanine ligase